MRRGANKRKTGEVGHSHRKQIAAFRTGIKNKKETTKIRETLTKFCSMRIRVS